MTLRERIQRGGERRRHQEPVSEFRRRTDRLVFREQTRDERPEWLRRHAFNRDLTEVTP